MNDFTDVRPLLWLGALLLLVASLLSVVLLLPVVRRPAASAGAADIQASKVTNGAAQPRLAPKTDQ